MEKLNVLIVIPSQNKRPEMLNEALESIDGQTVSPYQIIVASGAGSLADRVNTAISISDCDAFVVLGDDDKLDPCFLQKTSEAMTAKGVDIVYTDCHLFGQRNEPGAARAWTQENIDSNTVPLVTSLCRKSTWEKVGGFADVPFFDWDFWWRCFYAGATAHWLRQPLWWYREHQDQASKTEDLNKSREMALQRFAELRKAMA